MIHFSVAAKKFLSHQQANSRMTKGYVSKDTVRTYMNGLQRFQRHLESQQITIVEEINGEHLRRYLANLRQKGLSASSAALQQIILRSFFRWASLTYKHVGNVAKEVERIRLERQEAKHIDTQGQESLLAFLWQDKKSRRRNAIMFELMLRTGARVSEIASMDLGSLELSSQGIKLSFLGKGNKRRELTIPSITEGQPGSLEIRRFRDRLQEYLGRRRRWRVKPGHDRALFLTNAGHRITPRRIQAAFKYYRRRLNLHGCTPHSLRHSCLTNLLQRGVDLATVSRLAGHSSIQVTASTYLHTDPNKLKEATAKAFVP